MMYASIKLLGSRKGDTFSGDRERLVRLWPIIWLPLSFGETKPKV